MTSLDPGSLVLGGNVFGWTADRDESFAVLDAFVAGGGRSIDTADVYSQWVPGNSGGDSELIIGEWLASRGNRDAVEIHTKVFAKTDRPGLSPANLSAAVDDSLDRLQTDHLDLWQVHEVAYAGDPERHFMKGGVIEALDRAHPRDLRHAQTGRVVGLVDVATVIERGLVGGAPDDLEVLLRRERAAVPLGRRPFRHVVEERLRGRADDGHDVCA